MTFSWCGITYGEPPNDLGDLIEILVLARFWCNPLAMLGQCRQYQL
jgi:hypothetical protein